MLRSTKKVLDIMLILLLTGMAWAQEEEEKKLVSVFPFQAVEVSEADATTLTGLFETYLGQHAGCAGR